MSVDAILSKLEKVKRTGHGRWLACCPHHEDRSPSMAITEVDDGRILIHCFAGCPPNDILASIGLSFDALFPEKLPQDHKSLRRPFNAHDILAALRKELTIAQIHLSDVAKGRAVSHVDEQRFQQAATRIKQGEDLANGR